jgi:presequence protease
METDMNYNKEIYELIMEQNLGDISSKGYLFKHKKSGARIAMVSNDDENKVFCIGFRTPPADSTGVPHILEHSVLCGSDKYPAKDPFVELVKGSLNTFLNAMTFPDKTIYPIASCNDVDYKNLTDVYMDAVFHPNIYTREQIFKQEGWHYELENVDAPLTYNGVVYNEMKGAFSSPTQRVYRMCLNSLYPDTPYATESGGDPEFIPDLSYEQFLNFHKTLYHPANSYIYVYGNCDMEERLEYFDREYLRNYDEIKVGSDIPHQKPFDKQGRVEGVYSVTEEEGTENKTYLAYNASIGESGDMKLALAFTILEYALFNAPGAPVRQALIDAGIGEDVSGSYDNSIRQPMVTIMSTNTNSNREEEFVRIIREALEKLVNEGVNKDTLRAGINYNEFRYREADFGRWPKGLMYGIDMFGTWLYDDEKPFYNMQLSEAYDFLKKQVDTDYFEELIKKYLLDNPHSSVVVLKPEVGYTAKLEVATAKKLAEYKKTLSNEQLQTLVYDTKALKDYQSEPSTKEELESIPLLKREDIGKKASKLYNTEKSINGVKVLHHNINTNGIGYLRLSFNLDKVDDELLGYAGLLSKVLGAIGTEKYSFVELSNAMDIRTGGINVSTGFTPFVKPSKDYRYSLDIAGKALYGDLAALTELMEEIMNHTIFDDYKRLKEIIGETKAGIQMRMQSTGNAVGVAELAAQINESGAVRKQISGRGFYSFLDDAYKNYDEKKESLVAGMKKAAEKIFTKCNLIVSYTADDKGYELISRLVGELVDTLASDELPVVSRKLELKKTKLALKTSGQVNFVCRVGDYSKAGVEYTGAMRILSSMMNSDYLWNNIRVKGGAYGCGAAFGGFASSLGAFTSYRDPNLEKTNEIYEKAPEYVENFEADEREMTKYVIGTISDLDIPKTPSAKGSASFDAYIGGLTEQMLQKERDEVLNATVDDIRSLHGMVKAVLDDGYLCVVGNEDKINGAKDMFDVIEPLA